MCHSGDMAPHSMEARLRGQDDGQENAQNTAGLRPTMSMDFQNNVPRWARVIAMLLAGPQIDPTTLLSVWLSFERAVTSSTQRAPLGTLLSLPRPRLSDGLRESNGLMDLAILSRR